MKNKIKYWHSKIHCYFVLFKMNFLRSENPFHEVTNYHYNFYFVMLMIALLTPVVLFNYFTLFFSIFIVFPVFLILFLIDLILYRNSSYGDFDKTLNHIQILGMTKNETIKNHILNDMQEFIQFNLKDTSQILLLNKEIDKYTTLNNQEYIEYKKTLENIKKIREEKVRLSKIEKDNIKKLRLLQEKGIYVGYKNELEDIEETEKVFIEND